MITRKEQYDWAIKRVEELLPMVSDDMPLDNPKLIELELLSNLVSDYEEANYPIGPAKKNDVQDFPKIDVQDYPVDKDIQALAGTIVIPPLNDGIPENVSLKDIRKAVDRYEQADKRWKESFKRRDLGVKEDAGDDLYRLAKGLLKRGALYTWRDAVLDSWEKDKDIPNPDDFDAEND